MKEEVIPVEPLKEGEAYFIYNTGLHGEEPENPSFWMLGRVSVGNNGENYSNSLRGVATYISCSEQVVQFEKTWCYRAQGRKYRRATTQEIVWLEDCISEKRMVPKDMYEGVKYMMGNRIVANGRVGKIPSFQPWVEPIVESIPEDKLVTIISGPARIKTIPFKELKRLTRYDKDPVSNM